MKYLSTIILSAFLSFQSFSQDYKFEAGVQGGLNVSYFTYKNTLIQEARKPTNIQFAAGLFFQYNLSEHFSLRIDPTFERKGYKYKESTFTDNSGNVIGKGNAHGHFDYITIPVLFRASAGTKIIFFVNAGPSIGLLLSEKFISESPYGKQIFNNTSRYNTVDLGFTAGLGIAIPVSDILALSLEIRNNTGLTNINKNANKNYAVHANTIGLVVGLVYKFGSK